jgi:hypothetical protein
VSDGRESWYLPDPEGEGTFVHNAHPRGTCAGSGCALHGPSAHWLRDMPMRWSPPEPGGGPGRMERRCPHGAWHPDPDDGRFRAERGDGPVCDPCCPDCRGRCEWWLPPF